MFDINAGEFIILVALAVIIFGPEKLPELARKAARVVAYLRGIANDAKGQLKEQLGPEYEDLKHLAELNPKRILADAVVGDEVAGVKEEVAGAASAVRESLAAAHPGGDAAQGVQATVSPVLPSVPFDPEAT